MAVIILIVATMFLEGANTYWQAEEWQHEHNLRGFIGCEDGHLVVRNFDIGDTGSWTVIRFPDKNPCPQVTP